MPGMVNTFTDVGERKALDIITSLFVMKLVDLESLISHWSVETALSLLPREGSLPH